jgi:hypothetical protein
MWLLTPRGFFSAVQDRNDPDRVLVRARVGADLEALRDLLPEIEVVFGEGTDYPWRAWIPRDDWARAVHAMCGEIDYGNFKNAVADRQGYARAGIYSEVWGSLHGLERLNDA